MTSATTRSRRSTASRSARWSRRPMGPRSTGAFVAHTPDEVLVNSGEFSAMPAPEGGRAIVAKLAEQELARQTIRYRLRDWLLVAAALLGLPDPGRPLRRVRDRPGAGRRAARAAARDRRVPAEGPFSACRRRGLGADHVSGLRRRGDAVRRTRWTRSSTRPGTSSATRTRRTTASRSRVRSPTTGCPSTSTSAASSTRSCTCSTRGSS